MGVRIVKVCAAMAIAVLVQAWMPERVHASGAIELCEAPEPSAQARKARISGGFNGKLTWLTADRDDLRIRKFTAKGGGSTLELGAHGDLVVINVEGGVVRVARQGRTLTVDSPEALESLQELLAGSKAMYHTRAMLSELEGESRLKGLDMSVLSAAAFAVSLTGDTGAPLRLADRFMARHRGFIRQVRFESEDSCWTSYETEVNDSWNDLQECMATATEAGGWLAGVRRVACNATWLLRGESAWFEYIKCLSPLTGFPKDY